LPEQDAADVYDDIRKGPPPPRARDRGLSARHLMPFFSTSMWDKFDDSENVRLRMFSTNLMPLNCDRQGFFTIYDNLFRRLAQEEAQFTDIVYPAFGTSSWPWASPDKASTEAAKTFYAAWTNFSTEKDFVWQEQCNLNEARDRRIRRYVV
jgi:DnaJ family protein A protein 5